MYSYYLCKFYLNGLFTEPKRVLPASVPTLKDERTRKAERNE